ncbi:MAG TPA: response regulator, partial [Flavobacteriales bacterium]|nr:response regulator [Flavobacteriales bacterium]
MPAVDPIEHILLIDDEEDCNFVTRMVLKRSGFTGRITCFTNATAALEHLRSERDRPDLMFVDINMPGMTGF